MAWKVADRQVRDLFEYLNTHNLTMAARKAGIRPANRILRAVI